MLYRLKVALRELVEFRNLPVAARNEYLSDHIGIWRKDPGIDLAVSNGINWLCLAQDKSISQDGGVAIYYSLLTGWGASYPETTGYIIPTMIDYSKSNENASIRQRAKRMLDWLVSIQLEDGSYQGGDILIKKRVPTVFNTGQILLGLVSGFKEFGDEYRTALCRAATWLVNVQDSDGCWRKYVSPLVVPGEKAYHAHVAWGLMEAARIFPDHGYGEAAIDNIHWVLRQQKSNGWFQNCCLDDPERPLTHTIGYTLRGVLEAYLFNSDPKFLEASILTADGILSAFRDDGFLPGRLLSDWGGAVGWSCLTGTVQIAHCWLILFQITGEKKYWEAALIANRYVRSRMRTNWPLEQRGGIKGAFPVNGHYHAFNYINWAVKFFVDSNILEKEIREGFQTRTSSVPSVAVS
jgi:hypothetical protein